MGFRKFLRTGIFLLSSSGLFAQVPRSHHVVVVTLENHSYEQVIGNASMPYYNQLARNYGVTNQFYANLHNSLTDLFWMTAGQVVTENDATTKFFDVPNIVRQMQRDGRSWRVYASGLPYAGYLGGNTGNYLKRHNPIAYFSDVQSSLRYNIVPLSPNWGNDIAAGHLREYSFVVPDIMEDAHNGTLAQTDLWLKEHIPRLLQSPEFQQDGILLIVWDEGSIAPYDNRHGGGRVADLVIGPGVKPGFRSTTFYNQQSILRTTCQALALSQCPGAGSTATSLYAFFK